MYVFIGIRIEEGDEYLSVHFFLLYGRVLYLGALGSLLCPSSRYRSLRNPWNCLWANKHDPFFRFIGSSMGNRVGQRYESFFFMGALSFSTLLHTRRNPHPCRTPCIQVWERKIDFVILLNPGKMGRFSFPPFSKNRGIKE